MSTRSIRILQLCEHFGNNTASFHGVARSFEQWLPHLNEPPFTTLLCSRAAPQPAALERFRAIGIEPLSLGYGKFDPRNLIKLLGLLRRKRIDLLHLHGYGACTWGRIAGRLLGLPAIVHERCNYHTVPWFQRPVERLLGPGTPLAFAVSESTRVFTVRKRFIPDDRVKLLYSGIALSDVPPIDEAETKTLRAARGVGQQEILFGVVSRLEPHKGHLDVFEAFAGVHAQRPGTRLWVLGDGFFQPELERRCRSMGLEAAVDFLGYQANIWPFLGALDAQVFPSHQEGTPNTLYEAMAVGRAIVASTADGQGEILADGRDALLYTPGDVDRLGHLMARMCDEPETRKRLAAAAAVRIKAFDMHATIATMKDAYLNLLAART